MRKIFDLLTDAVVTAEGGVITYHNAAASALLPGIDAGAPVSSFFPEHLLGFDSGDYVGEMTLAGKSVTVSVNRDGGGMTFVLCAGSSPNDKEPVFKYPAVSRMNESLSIIKMATGLIQQHLADQGSDRLNKYAAMVIHNYYIMLRLVNDVRWASDGEVRLNRSVFDLKNMMQQVVSYTRELVDDRGLELSFDMAEKDLIIYADKDKLEIMLAHLLSNSIKNTPDGGRISMSAKVSGHNAVITLSDTGSGIPRARLRDVWNRYGAPFRADEPLTGLGIGLSMVQSIASAHGGCAILESEPGRGTTVTVSIRIENAPDDTVGSPGVEYLDTLRQLLLRDLSDVISLDKYGYKYMD